MKFAGQVDGSLRFWPTQYQKFRTIPLEEAEQQLKTNKPLVIVSADFANYYDTIDPTFLLSHVFLRELQRDNQNVDIMAFTEATESLLRLYIRYHRMVNRRLKIPVRIGVPIGALTSRVVANVALSQFDKVARAVPGVVSYSRYVDDFVFVAEMKSGGQVDFKAVIGAFRACGECACECNNNGCRRPKS